MTYLKIMHHDTDTIAKLSQFASSIVKEHYDPILGSVQNDYMIDKFQSSEAIIEQIMQGHYYYLMITDVHKIGFIAFYPRENDLYISKFYLQKDHRGKGLSKDMFSFIISKARELGFDAIVLNVNKYNRMAIRAYEKLGFIKTNEEKNDIGNGYFMDDFVYRYNI